MNAAATLLAGFGLLQNSPAVIIGAMLVAMLLGPIVGIALGLAEADVTLLGRSLVAEVVGVIWVLTIAYVLGTASRSLSIGSEILNRTSPTILDLLIGLVGGLAGAFTYVSGISSSIDIVRHSAGSPPARARGRSFSPIPRQLHCYHGWCHNGLLAGWTSAARYGQGKKGTRTTTDITCSATGPRHPPNRNPAQGDYPNDLGEQYPKDLIQQLE